MTGSYAGSPRSFRVLCDSDQYPWNFRSVCLLDRWDVHASQVGHQEAQELQERVWQSIPQKQEGHIPIHPLEFTGILIHLVAIYLGTY